MADGLLTLGYDIDIRGRDFAFTASGDLRTVVGVDRIGQDLMPLTIPTHDQIVASIIADVQSSVRISVGGQLVAPSFAVGTVNMTLADLIALVLYSFYGQLDQVDRGLRLPSAQGSDLDD